MKSLRWLQSVAVGIASFGLIMPRAAFAVEATLSAAASPTPAAAPTPTATPTATSVAGQSQVLDVGLAAGGMLRGQVVDPQGLPMRGVEVSLNAAKGHVATCSTDQEGRFEIHNLGGGLYEVAAAGKSGAFRLWTDGTSPPQAVKQVLLVAGQPVTRGQWVGRGGWLGGGGGAYLGGAIILGSLGGIIAGGIISGEQSGPSS
ncbi:MAG TPA: carboxypeptidase-like regulatory domain-containing protein [Pirellulales bacterium]|nr:carboxypeptidase-like regulatory domain-containing protein [Pirellulales bacterium]